MPFCAIKRERSCNIKVRCSQSAICLTLWLISLYCTCIGVCDGLLWSPTNHHCSRCLYSYQGPCSIIKPALSKLWHEQSTEGHCKQYMNEGWQCFTEEWQRNHIWWCVLLQLRFHGVGNGLQTHSNIWHTPLPQHLPQVDLKVLFWSVNVIDPYFHKETETSWHHQGCVTKAKPKWFLSESHLKQGGRAVSWSATNLQSSIRSTANPMLNSPQRSTVAGNYHVFVVWTLLQHTQGSQNHRSAVIVSVQALRMEQREQVEVFWQSCSSLKSHSALFPERGQPCLLL